MTTATGTRADMNLTSQVSYEDAEKILNAFADPPIGTTFSATGGVQRGLPLILDSESGSGKSSLVTRWANKRYRRANPHFRRAGEKDEGGAAELRNLAWQVGLIKETYTAFETLTIGAQGEGRFGVIPVPKMITLPDGRSINTLDFPPPMDLVLKFFDGVGCILFDDLAQTPPALSPVMLDGLQRRRIGTWYMGDLVYTVGCTNSVKHAGGWPVPAPAVNRAGWIPVADPAPDALGRYLQLKYTAEEQEEAVAFDLEKHLAWFDAQFHDAYANASRITAGFIQAKPDVIRTPFIEPETQDSDRAALPFATPRSWEYATIALAAAKVHNFSSQLANTSVAAFVGQTPANEMDVYAETCDLPRPREFLESVLRGQPIFSHSPARFDRTAVVLSSCVALVAPQRCENRIDMAKALWTWMDTIREQCADQVGPAAYSLFKSKLHTLPAAMPVINSLEPVLFGRLDK